MKPHDVYHDNSLRTHPRQKGAALIISLIFLMIITILSVSAMRTTNLDTKITVNHQFKELSFQAAESALAQATTPTDTINSSAKALSLRPRMPNSVEGAFVTTDNYFISPGTNNRPALAADLTMTYIYGLAENEPADPSTGKIGYLISGYPPNSGFNTYLATAQGSVAQSGTRTTNRTQVLLMAQ
jgi:type IV pilus assembly protein PilX